MTFIQGTPASAGGSHGGDFRSCGDHRRVDHGPDTLVAIRTTRGVSWSTIGGKLAGLGLGTPAGFALQ